MANGVNANLARRWVLGAERHVPGQLATTSDSGIVPASFVPLQLPPAQPPPEDIRIELRRGATVINVSWPSGAAAECAAWMHELLR